MTFAAVHVLGIVKAPFFASRSGVDRRTVESALVAMAADYEERRSGLALRNVAGGWRLSTHPDAAPYVEQFVLSNRHARLTKAGVETLAIVAYKQPVSRARVSAIRGVNVDGVMRTLVARGLVEEAGQDHTTGSHLYRTSGYFLERIGVTSLDQLPELAPYLPEMDDLVGELGETIPGDLAGDAATA